MTRILKPENRSLKPDTGKSDGFRYPFSVFRILLSVFLLSAFCFLASAPAAQAACSNPAGNAGTVVYNGGYQVVQYCNGGAWVSIGPFGNTTSGLVGWWKLDDGSGTSAADATGNGNTGTLFNSPTWTTSGMNGGALTFNGASQYVSVPEVASLELAGSWTVSAWVNFSALPSSGNEAVLVQKLAAADFANYQLLVDNGWACGAGVGWTVYFSVSGSGSVCAKYTTSINTGTWYHLAGVWDSSTNNQYLYVNGALVATHNVVGLIPPSTSGSPLYLGNTKYANGVANAMIDDARVYNRALSAADIKTLYTSTGGESGDINTGLKGYWKLDEASGTKAADSSGNSNTGTASGTTVVAGKMGNARSFNGTSDSVQTPSINLSSTQAVTVSMWVNRTYLAGSGHAGPLIEFSNNYNNYNDAFAFFADDYSDCGSVDKAFNIGIISSSGTNAKCYAAPTSGVWHLLTVVYDTSQPSAGEISLYIDGVLQTLLSQPYSNDNTNTFGNHPFYMFERGGSTLPIAGTIDEVRIYNRALSASDVLTLYNSTVTACASPVDYAGDVIYNAGTNHVLQFCNGSSWIPMGPVPGAGTGPGCSSPAGSEGQMIYSSGKQAVQYCDGTNWVPLGGAPSVGTTTGLVGWWKLDETSGTSAADSSGNSNTGTLTNGPTWTTTGKINGALTFNGSTQYVNMGDINAMDGLTLITVSAWVKSSAAGANNGENHIVDKSFCDGSNNGGPFEFATGIGASEKAAFVIYPNGGIPTNWESSFDSATNVDDGNWHFLTGEYDGSTLSIWVDGVQEDSHTIGAVTLSSTTNAVEIGGWCNGQLGNFWNGTIDDVRVYNRALTASEVKDLYYATGGQ